MADRKFSELNTITTFDDTSADCVHVYVPGQAAAVDRNKRMTIDSLFTVLSSETLTFTNKTLTSPDIDGGTIDNTVIGGTTPAAVSGTTGDFTGNLGVGGSADQQGTGVRTLTVDGGTNSYSRLETVGQGSSGSAFIGTWDAYSLQDSAQASRILVRRNTADNDARMIVSVNVLGTLTQHMEFSNGDTQVDGDLILATAGKLVDLSAGGFVKHSVTGSITAGTTQTQAGATALTTEQNYIATCANVNDGVKLPTAQAGLEIHIRNNGANAAQVWPNTSDAIDGGAADAVDSNTLASGASRVYAALDGTNWYTDANS